MFDVNHVSFAQLQAFLAVARARSFAAAAGELGVSRSAISQHVRQLEEELGVLLVTRTTRSVSLTDAGQRLVESAGPAVDQTRAALAEASAPQGALVGRLRLTVPRVAMHFVLSATVPVFCERNPRIELELVFEDRMVDVVAGRFDGGIRLSEYLERDMVGVRLTGETRLIVVGSPAYLARRGTPRRPDELLAHDCLTFRSESTGALYAWEFERGRKSWRIPVRGSVVSNDGLCNLAWAERGVGLVYTFESVVTEHLAAGTLVEVLAPYAVTVPGFFLFYPRRTQRSAALRAFADCAREVLRSPRRSRPASAG